MQMTDAELDQWVSDSLSHLDSTCAGPPWEDAAAGEDTLNSTIPAATASQPVITLALPGIPGRCGTCGEAPAGGIWPLTVYGGLVHVACPACWAIAAPVRAVAASMRDASPGGSR
ncbi:MAG TPA: hypothetical protein VKV80_15075 [Streptosporangiaceae bacterium]|nr:hypothetical protein [Streptosporangiaceae bacterium]